MTRNSGKIILSTSKDTKGSEITDNNGFRFQVSGFRAALLRVSGFRFQVSGFRAAELRVSGFKFQVSGLAALTFVTTTIQANSIVLAYFTQISQKLFFYIERHEKHENSGNHRKHGKHGKELTQISQITQILKITIKTPRDV